MEKISHFIHRTLNSPLTVIFYCFVFLFLNLVLNGSLYKLYELSRSQSQIQQQIVDERNKLKNIQQQIKVAQDPAFIERQARDQLELLEKDDLLFVFADDNPE